MQAESTNNSMSNLYANVDDVLAQIEGYYPNPEIARKQIQTGYGHNFEDKIPKTVRAQSFKDLAFVINSYYVDNPIPNHPITVSSNDDADIMQRAMCEAANLRTYVPALRNKLWQQHTAKLKKKALGQLSYEELTDLVSLDEVKAFIKSILA